MSIPLVCFPFAGAGASFFRPWADRLGDRFEIVAVQLPGREQRFCEDPHTDVAEAVAELLPDLARRLAGRKGAVVFGHSLGAVLAYEATRRLRRQPSVSVSHLIVSGSPSPTRQRHRRATGLTDEEFLQQVRTFAGYSHPALEDPEMRELLLPVLRADVEMHEKYAPAAPEVLDTPITCLRGRHDDLVSAEDAADWQSVTHARLDMVEVDGGHMYLVDAADHVFGALEGVRALAA